MDHKAVIVAYDVFRKHFGLAYATTYDKKTVHLLSRGFVAAMDMATHDEQTRESVHERIMQPFESK